MIRKATFLKLHRWIGLVVGMFLAVQGLTGAALVFRDAIERVIHPALVLQPDQTRLPAQALLDAVTRRHPGADIVRAEFPVAADQAVQVRSTIKQQRWVCAVDPFTAAIVVDGTALSWPMEWIFNLHEQLLAGTVGATLIGIEGIALLFMAVTGLIYWWPGTRRLRQGFRIRWKGSTDLRWRTLHRAVGASVALLLLVSATTGIAMVWKEPFRDALKTVATVQKRPAPKVDKQPGAAFVPVDTLVAEAQATYGMSALRQLRFSSGGRVVAVYLTGTRTIRADGMTQVYYNRYDGAELGHYVAGTLPAASEFIDWLYAVHTGLWGAALTQTLMVLVGLMLAGMAASGLWLRYSRTARRRATSTTRK